MARNSTLCMQSSEYAPSSLLFSLFPSGVLKVRLTIANKITTYVGFLPSYSARSRLFLLFNMHSTTNSSAPPPISRPLQPAFWAVGPVSLLLLLLFACKCFLFPLSSRHHQRCLSVCPSACLLVCPSVRLFVACLLAQLLFSTVKVFYSSSSSSWHKDRVPSLVLWSLQLLYKCEHKHTYTHTHTYTTLTVCMCVNVAIDSDCVRMQLDQIVNGVWIWINL